MAIIFNVAHGESDLPTLLSDQDSNLDSRTGDLHRRDHGRGSQELTGRVAGILLYYLTEGAGQPFPPNLDSGVHPQGAFLASGLQSDQTPTVDIHSKLLGPHVFWSTDHMSDLRAVSDICNVLRLWHKDDFEPWASGQISDIHNEEPGSPITMDRFSNLLADHLILNQGLVTVSSGRLEHPRRLSLNQVNKMEDVCEILRTWGEYDLADRMAYFASDADLEEGDVPVTLESALGFLSFFASVKSEVRVSLSCSPEGWICAVWRFPDERRASLWFLDSDRVMFAATNADGYFVEIDGGGEVSSSRDVMEKLIQAGLLTWDLDTPNSGSFHTSTTLPDIVESGILQRMDFQPRMRSYSARTRTNVISPPIGWNTSTTLTDDSRSTALSNL